MLAGVLFTHALQGVAQQLGTSNMTHREALETLLATLERKLWLAQTSIKNTAKQKALLQKQIEALRICLN